MKSTITLLTLAVVAVAFVPRTSFGQYNWVPVYSNEPAPISTPASPSAGTSTAASRSWQTQSSGSDQQADPIDHFGQQVSTFIGDIENREKSGCELNCDCPSCRHRNWRSRAFFGVEYLHWFNKGRNLPPLVTRGGNGTLPGATILFGGGEVGDDLKAAGRLTGGLWLDEGRSRAIVVRAFGTEGDSSGFAAAQPATGVGGPVALAVPFISQAAATIGQENALLLAASDQAGGVDIDSSNDVLGGDVYARMIMDEGCNYRIDLLGGYQTTRIDDDLVINTSTMLGPNTFTTTDRFDVENEFHASTIGLMGEFFRGPVTLQMMGKLGIGNMRQSVSIDGNFTRPGGITGQGGLFTQPDNPPADLNIGNFERDLLVWSPEVSFKTTYNVSERLSLSVGYSFLYWTRVALAGDQVDRNVNNDLTFNNDPFPGGGANPAFNFRDTDFWVQSIDIGLLMNY